MEKFVLIAACMALAGETYAGEPASTGTKPLAGVYEIYGGGLGDKSPPSTADKKVMMSITGAADRSLFDSIGPDKKDECTDGQGMRVRMRDNGNFFCMRYKDGHYKCNFGFDLITGKSIGGIIC